MSDVDTSQGVEVTEVGPRDGLQSEPRLVPTREKIALVEDLIASGLRSFEITSFVSPRAVPQLHDAADVVAALRHHRGVELGALVPNAKGALRAAAAGVNAMIVFVSASQSHNLKNLNATRAASLSGLATVAEIASDMGIRLKGAIATSFGCPFEGEVPVDEVVRVAEAYADLGITRISLGDTTGMATPGLVSERVRALRKALPEVELALHFHNTRGLGLVCAWEGLAEGIRRFESSVGGLGGCPFVPDATGNISTEDLVHLLHVSGYQTGVDLDRLAAVARQAETIVGHPLPGQVMKAGPRSRIYPMDSARTAHG